MKTIIPIIISIVTAIAANAQTVNIAAAVQNSVYEGPLTFKALWRGRPRLPWTPRRDMMHFFALRASTPTRSVPPKS